MKAPLKKATAASTAAAFTFIVALVLSGCATSPLAPGAKPVKDTATTQPTDQATVAPTDDDDDVDSGFDDWMGGSGDGSGIDYGSIETGTTVPKDFPTNVPLFKGQIIEGTGITMDGDRMWSVRMTVPDISNTFAAVRAALQSAGFTDSFSQDDEEGAIGMFSGNGFGVIAAIDNTDGEFVLGYLVSKE